jgi:hypothetical protein
MRWIWGLIRGIWGLFRLFLAGVAFTAGAGGLYGILFEFFFAVGLVLVIFGVSLDSVDNWLDARADWFEWIGTILFKGLLAIILVCCVLVVGRGISGRLPLPGRPPRHRKHRTPRAHGQRRVGKAAVGQRMARAKGAPRLSESGELLPGTESGSEPLAASTSSDKPMGCGAMIAAIIVGYFCYVGLVNKL